MHIPDGALNSITCAISYAVMIPLWATAFKKISENLRHDAISIIILGTAFSFAVMMINFDIPGGSTANAIGASILSILFSPWISSVMVTFALAIQALIFHDGGITTFAANSFAIAFIPSFAGYYVYKKFSGLLSENIHKNEIAAGISGYCSLCAGALAVAALLILQPIINYFLSGGTLHFSNSLKSAVSALFFTHLMGFGWIEGILTALTIGFLVKEKSPLLNLSKKLS